MALNKVGFENVALHAMITQKQRLAALAKFKSGSIKILIATDVASRGKIETYFTSAYKFMHQHMYIN